MMVRYISADELAARYGVNRSTIWRWQARGVIPRPVKISDQCTRWKLDEIERRDAEREQTSAA